MRPHIVMVASGTREGRENLEFLDALAESPMRNAKVIIALAQKLISVTASAQASMRSRPERTHGAKRGKPAIPEERKLHALTLDGPEKLNAIRADFCGD